MKPPTTNTEALQQSNQLGKVSRKTMWGLKPVLLARNLALISDAAPNQIHVRSA